jgi:hypothetical protein
MLCLTPNAQMPNATKCYANATLTPNATCKMAKKNQNGPEIRTIVMIDAVNFSGEIKSHGRDAIAPKINALREFVEFFFIYKLKGAIIGEMGDGFLLLCPPEPHRVLAEAFGCMRFVRATTWAYRSRIP